MRIIPAIDLIDGKCVRLTEGLYDSKKIYHDQPLEIAKQFEDAGIKYLHLVDLDGAKAGRVINWKVLEQICQQTSLTVDFGGGLKTREDISIVFESGASQITGGSIAVQQPDLFLQWLEDYGSERIILGADVKQMMIATNGWQNTSNRHIFDFLEFYHQKGVKYVICTDISKDGKLEGPSFQLYEELRKRFPTIALIASGGVTTLEEISQLKQLGMEGAIIGKAIYEQKITLEALKTTL